MVEEIRISDARKVEQDSFHQLAPMGVEEAIRSMCRPPQLEIADLAMASCRQAITLTGG